MSVSWGVKEPKQQTCSVSSEALWSPRVQGPSVCWRQPTRAVGSRPRGARGRRRLPPVRVCVGLRRRSAPASKSKRGPGAVGGGWAGPTPAGASASPSLYRVLSCSLSACVSTQNRPSVITCAPANNRNCRLSHCHMNGCPPGPAAHHRTNGKAGGRSSWIGPGP